MYKHALLATFTFFLICCLGCSSTKKEVSHEEPYSFYIGTYTSQESEGIYKATLNTDGTFSPVTLMAKTADPSFLTITEDKQILLAVNEVKKGTVQSYKVTKKGLSLISQNSSGGVHPCHIAIDKEGRIVTSNYTSGTVGLLQLNEDGSLSDLLNVNQHKGSGKHQRQDGPHAHSTYFLKDNVIVSADLGTNDLWFSNMIDNEPYLKPAYKLKMAANAGPRHLAMHPDKETMLVVNELDCTISLINKSGYPRYKIESTISTLPADYDGKNTCADIHISKDGKYAYVSNRGHNSIAILSIDAERGQMKLLGHESTRGKTPRNFALTPNEKFLVVANQESNNIVSFKRESKSGMLTYSSEVEAKTPVCLLF